VNVEMICDDCSRIRTLDEIHWYGRRDGSGRCEGCERAWSDRMGRWMRGETFEPELDAMFSGPRGLPRSP
jgi:hypothetical protein